MVPEQRGHVSESEPAQWQQATLEAEHALLSARLREPLAADGGDDAIALWTHLLGIAGADRVPDLDVAAVRALRPA